MVATLGTLELALRVPPGGLLSGHPSAGVTFEPLLCGRYGPYAGGGLTSLGGHRARHPHLTHWGTELGGNTAPPPRPRQVTTGAA